MNYTAEHIDVDKIEDALHDYRDHQRTEMVLAQEKARSFFEGYEKAISDIQGMFHCCNYESDEKRTTAFKVGVNAAINEICKDLDIESKDIQNIDAKVSKKAELIAERIKSIFVK